MSIVKLCLRILAITFATIDGRPLLNSKMIGWITNPQSLLNQKTLLGKEHIFADNRGENVREGNSYLQNLPGWNRRRIRVEDLTKFGKLKAKIVQKLEQILKKKVPIFEDKEKVMELELAILKKNAWASCEWVVPLPYPLDKDKQCTQGELKYILESNLLPGNANTTHNAETPRF